MASKLLARDPATSTVIRDITPTLTTFSVPFYRFGRIYIGGRATVGKSPLGSFADSSAKLKSGSLAVFSPVAFTPEIRTKLQELGNNVRYLIAPDMEHHMQLGPWHKEYPEAAIIGVEGLQEKRDKQGDDKVPVSTIFTAKDKLTTKISDEFDAEFDVEFFEAHQNKELVFNKRDERTLIEADLLFNLGKQGAKEQFSKSGQDPRGGGFLSNLFLDLMSAEGEAKGQQRYIWYAGAKADRASFGESAKRVQAWDFDRIIPCHGDVIETGGKPIFEKIMQWFLNGKN